MFMELKNQTVIEYLLCHESDNEERTVLVKCENQDGHLQFQNSQLSHAKCGRLQGNGAAMIIAGWKNCQLQEVAEPTLQKKNVSLSLQEIARIVQGHKLESIDLDESTTRLKEALLHLYSFRFREAGAIFTSLLRSNRYDYTSWLWYSRLLGKTSSAESALGEAQKWGRHVKEIWEEAEKLGKLVGNNVEKIKRCHFCWSPLSPQTETCPTCNVQLSITQSLPSSAVNKNNIQSSLSRFKKSLQQDPENPAILYVMALGFFNLGLYAQALEYQRQAVHYGPSSNVYRTSLQHLEALCPSSPPPKAQSTVFKTKYQTLEERSAQLSPHKKTVLVVEDSPTSQKVLKMVLTRAGLQTLNARTGVEALKHIRNHDPDLILLDIMLPDMTGHDILPKIREKKSLAQVPVIMLTGKTSSMDRVKGLRGGSSEYLTKPFDPQKLIAIINKYL